MDSIRYLYIIALLLLISSCQDDDATLSAITVPSDLQVTAVVEAGQTGNVTITPTAADAMNFHVFFMPNSDPSVVTPGTSTTFRYTRSGQYTVPITVVAYGTGGTATTKTITVALDVRLFIDTQTLQQIAGDGTKRWVWDQTVGGHFGVGPITNDFPEFFSASANQLNECLYDDVLVFNYDQNDIYTFQLLTGAAGTSFVNWAEITRFFPNDTPAQFVDECRDISDQIATDTSFIIIDSDRLDTNGNPIKELSVANSTLSYWSGATTYDILELTSEKLSLRGIQEVPADFGGGLLAWYHTFVPETVAPVGTLPFDTLVWADEFDTAGFPDPTKWTYDIGTGTNGWGNGEAQSYTDSATNVSVVDGVLKITARAENGGYTSGRIKTQGLFDFTYGKVAVRAKLPSGGGTWPAIWMLGANITEVGWPACGEIDIMEHVGNNQDVVSSALHFPENSGADAIFKDRVLSGASTDFHIYEVSWTPDTITFSIDSVPYHTYEYTNDLPFYENNFFLLLNLAMGGNFGGTIDPLFTEATLEIDYVRVYQ